MNMRPRVISLLKSKGVFIISIVLLFCEPIISQDAFKSSAKELSDGNVELAIVKLTELLEQGKSSKELFSNLGYAYFQQNDMGNAMLYYHKALKVDPTDARIQESIRTVRDQLDIQITEIPDFVLVTTFRKISNLMNATSWGALQVLSGILSIICLALILFPKGLLSNKTLKWAGISSLILTLLFGIFAFSKRQTETSKSQAIVMKAEQNIHVSPDEISPVIRLV